MAGEAAGEFHDWEILTESSESDSVMSTDSFRDLEGFEGESQGMIQADYFSLDNSNCLKLSSNNHETINSDNPSRVNPESDGPVIEKESLEVWPNSSSDRSDDLKFRNFVENYEVGSVGNGKNLVGFEGIREIDSTKNKLGSVGNGKTIVGFEGIGEIDSPKNELGSIGNEKTLSGLEEIGEMNSLENESGFIGNGKTLMGFEEIAEMGSEGEFSLTKKKSSFNRIEPQSLEFSKIGQDPNTGKGIYVNSDVGDEIPAEENDVPSREKTNTPMEVTTKAAGEGEKKSVVWWKVPFELLRFCAFRVGPVWTFSMAAAVMGVVMLTRKLYMMKKKSRTLQLKVSMNDKKVSQYMSRAARLNEAFSVVKRVPVIRPALPAASGLNQWPVMNLR